MLMDAMDVRQMDALKKGVPRLNVVVEDEPDEDDNGKQSDGDIPDALIRLIREKRMTENGQ